jgi:putative ABC transport system permease protein
VRALDLAASAWRSLASQRRRSLLSLAGITIGVAAVVALTALGEGARGFVRAQFEGIGSDVVAVVPGKTETTGLPGLTGSPNDLTLGDARALQRSVRGVVRVAPLSAASEAVSYAGRSRNVLVLGTTRDMAPIRGLELRAGDFLPDGDWERGAPVVVLGATTARELFPGESPVGARVRVGSWRVRVIGVLAPRGVHFGVDLDDAAFLPIATAQHMFDQRGLMRVLIELDGHARVASATEEARALLAARHGQDDVTLVTPDSVLASLSGILQALTLALAGIAAISLAVAGVGIMNVMLVAVSERRREIGLMKAVGATRAQVLAVFLAEAVLLATSGAAAGVALGLAAARVTGLLVPAFEPRAPLWAIGAAFALAVGVGAVFGVLPAARAMRLDPVAALRGR